MSRFDVHIIRETAPGKSLVYEMTVDAPSSADACAVLGDKIRANDLDDVKIFGGEHVWVPDGYPANIIHSRASRRDVPDGDVSLL